MAKGEPKVTNEDLADLLADIRDGVDSIRDNIRMLVEHRVDLDPVLISLDAIRETIAMKD